MTLPTQTEAAQRPPLPEMSYIWHCLQNLDNSHIGGSPTQARKDLDDAIQSYAQAYAAQQVAERDARVKVLEEALTCTDAANAFTVIFAASEVPPWREWKVGNEYLPYHPQASHVPPEYRDGWNACFAAAPQPPSAAMQPLTDEQRQWIVAVCPTPASIIDAVEAAHNITKAAP